MRLFISLLFFTISAMARPIRLFHEGGPQYAEAIKQSLIRDYLVPEDLIGTNMVGECSDLKERGKMDLCLKNNGDLLVVSIDREFVSESLKVFRAP